MIMAQKCEVGNTYRRLGAYVPITEGNYTEVEVKILGLIGSLNEAEAMSATEIGDAVGCTWQKVSNWCSKVLGKQQLINVKKINGKNYYFDKE